MPENIWDKLETKEDITPREAQNNETLKNKDYIWFDDLRKNFETKEHESIKNLLDLVWGYIDARLSKEFSLQEKNSIKLIIFSQTEKELNLWNLAWKTVEKLLKPLKSMIDSFSLEEKTLEQAKQNFDQISLEFDNLWLGNLRGIIDKKIEKVNETKKKIPTKNFEKLNDVLDIFNPNREKLNEKDILNKIKEKTNKLSGYLNKSKEIWSDVSNSLDLLPAWFWEYIKDWISKTIKQGWILWFILWFIFGENLEKNDKFAKPTKNLFNYYQKQESILKKSNIDEEKLKNLEPKKLEKFYKFLENEKIDYQQENFWEELFSWKTKNNKTKKLNDLLKKQNWKILEKNDWIDELLEKLNSSWSLYNQEKIKQQELELQQASLNSQNSSEKLVLTTTAVSTAQQAIQKAEQNLAQTQAELKKYNQTPEKKQNLESQFKQAQIDLEKAKSIEQEKIRQAEMAKKQAKIDKQKFQEKQFETSINTIWTNKEIKFEAKTYKIEFQWSNTLVLWDKKYKLSLISLEHNIEILKKIELHWNNVMAEYKTWIFTTEKTQIKTQTLKEILKSLLQKNEYEQKVEWKPAKFIVKQL